MAGTIGKITAALNSFTNENTFALANLSFDFALVKVAAPEEYGELGALMSPQRKRNAEDGPLHQTARKLGALFDDIAPNTPALFTAYGKRVSEIAREPEVNPRERTGIFASQIGVDSSSIWAAVTSGSSAIAVHLLSCMLARIFTGPEAISIWVELVKDRKAQIRLRHDDSMYKHEHDAALLASRQEITRDEIAIWDNSARAWLQSGDQARILQHKQLMLILDNLSLPVNNDENTFENVMTTWSSAMNAMECLLKGMPQRVNNGSAIIGLSAWHLYPSLAVLGDTVTSVRQNDALFEDTAILTIGLQFENKSQHGVSWSLPLSCLQYYGDPVRASRSIGRENSRISIDQFEHIILGCVFEHWGEFAETPEDGLKWLARMELLLSDQTEAREAQNGRNPQYVLWFNSLCSAGRRLRAILNTSSVESDLAKQELNFGRRRESFVFREGGPGPLFGIPSVKVLVSLMEDEERRIDLLRKVAQEYSLDSANFIIRYKTTLSSLSNCQRPQIEYASVAGVPVLDAQEIQGQRRKKRRVQKDRRWVYVTAEEVDHFAKCNCTSTKGRLYCLNRDAVLRCVENTTHSCSDEKASTSSTAVHCDELSHTPLWKRHDEIKSFGEDCFLVLDTYGSKESRRNRVAIGERLRFSSGTIFEEIFEEFTQDTLNDEHYPMFDRPLHFIAGHKDLAAIFRIDDSSNMTAPGDDASKEIVEQALKPGVLAPERLFEYLYEGWEDPWIENLQAYAAVTKIYSYLPHATVSTSVFSRTIGDGAWCRSASSRGNEKWLCPLRLSLPEVFSCIALFDSGIYDVSPDSISHAFAVSAGNSIFVSSGLLEDPHRVPNLSDVRRITGNIGKAGISFLVAPAISKMKAIDMENWRLINHEPFAGKLEDNFHQTSIHLSFTGYNLPLKTERKNRHIVDRPASLVETIVSVHDRGLWIADLNLVETLTFKDVEQLEQEFQSGFQEAELNDGSDDDEQAIDNWDELLDLPHISIPVVRTHKNWLARLAVTGVLWNMEGCVVVLLPAEPCWSCCGQLILAKRFLEAGDVRVVLVT
ncbi:hypothetical protein BKA65DRAFT_410970 [Rhexocercosporidium sp. MPI-PUGE-AT-0058]|nr:hypothetical protein BKA65DRAFT_410970 [Rhexocercosporidium sp. MPI-PUGE-AT-0058]